MIYNEVLNTILLDAFSVNDYKRVCGSCTLYIVLFAAFLVTSTVICTVFTYCHWYSEKKLLLMPITDKNKNSKTN